MQTFSPISVQLRAISKDEFAMQVNSKPASWLHIASLSDTIDQGSTKSSQTPIYVKAEQHQDLWLYTDSTAQLSLSFLIRRLPVRKYFLQISRTDSTEHGTVIHTITKKVNLQ
ncbi:MAG: hypothetical protein EOO88_15160 [Pedobacter sp.]|nr:MAG: hypothetical protein EOO88_15160 [Pedobacter sp.]